MSDPGSPRPLNHGPCWFHVDMDAFYASVEQRDNPEIQGKPVIVGALPGGRGVVSTCSYEARRFGVRSAMPVSQAYKLCPQGIFVLPRMDHYSRISRRIMAILEEFTPRLVQVSVDEAFLDMGGTFGLLGPPREIGAKIARKVLMKEGITLSIGMASNKLVAKMASAYKKPQGITLVEPGQEQNFVGSLALKDLWGLGKKTRERLEEMGVDTVGQLRSLSEQQLKLAVGGAGASFLYRLSRGIDPGIYDGPTKTHSLGNEVTFSHDVDDPQVIEETLRQLSDQLAFRLLDEKAQSSTLSLKLRFHDFSTLNRQKSRKTPFISADQTYQQALDLWNQARARGNGPIRLVGLRFENVVPLGDANQGELFDDAGRRSQDLERAILGLKQRFGGITRASRLKAPKNQNREEGS